MHSKEKNRSYLETLRKESCTGCGACEAICPVKCVVMKEDEEGFLYPEINHNKCINCSKCRTVCPHPKDEAVKLLKRAVAAVHKSDKILNDSSSGGAFYSLVQAWSNIYSDPTIFGVCIDDEFNVFHKGVRGISNISEFQKSKYVLSNMNDSYLKIKRLLDDGQAVLFSGTPCQISGLKEYIGKEYEKLLCVELFCHGAGSNSIFKKYIQEESKNKIIKKYSFRYKNEEGSRNLRIEYEDGSETIMRCNEDLYMSAYAEALFYRPSCLRCKYACEQRVGDVTIGDGWKIKKIYPQLNPDKGVSVVLFNNEKGMSLKNELKTNMELYDIPYNFLIETVDTMTEPTRTHMNRKKFFKIINKKSVHSAIELCLIRNCTSRRIVRWLIPNAVKQQIKRLLNMI